MAQDKQAGEDQRVLDLLGQMDRSRQTLESETLRLATLSQELRSFVLRHRDDMTSSYLAYSSAYSRICGAVAQGLRRTAHVGRVLNAARAHQEMVEQRSARTPARDLQEQTASRLPATEDFDLVYGDE